MKLSTLFFIVSSMSANHLFADDSMGLDDDFFETKTSIGGYGEIHYNHVTKANNPSSITLDFHRFVMFFSHSWTEQWSFKAELELEHNFVQNGQGELELEQAYINYHHSSPFGLQVGVVLPSIGLLNEHHEPPLFFSVERPDYAKVIVPTTWFGNGMSIYGRVHDFDYKLTVMEGLDATKFSLSSALRGGRYKGYKSPADELLYSARLNYLGMSGIQTGLSFTTTRAMGDESLADVPVMLLEVHSKLNKNGFLGAFEYGTITFGEGNLESSQGYYVDLGYNLSPHLRMAGELIPWMRISSYNTAASTMLGGDETKKYSYSKWMAGLTFKPIEEISFKVDYSVKTNELTNDEEIALNLGAGYQF